jgi:hypothetical protein
LLIAESGLTVIQFRNPNSAIRNSLEWLAGPAGFQLSPGSEALRLLLAT